MFKDPYRRLGVRRNAPMEEIKAAYRRLALAHHPDRNQGDRAAEERFKDVTQAFEILSDPRKRELLDRFGPDGPTSDRSRVDRSEPEGGWFGEFLDSLLGRERRPAGRARRAGVVAAGADVLVELDLSLAESFAGAEKSLRFRIASACPACGGAGRCSACAGRGVVRFERRLRIRIPPGARDGDTLRIPGQGEPGRRGTPAGDLRATVRLRLPRGVALRGDDIHLRLPVTARERSLGAKIPVRTPWGAIVVAIPARVATDAHLRIKSHGMQRRDEQGRGDLILVLTAARPNTTRRRTTRPRGARPSDRDRLLGRILERHGFT
ncbi:MAG: DnaJ C-terminal domain-containing protein [Myxococcota bacterium]|nr:DnaJ C-terminal domain-containing protein [Myxococcota bacterium]